MKVVIAATNVAELLSRQAVRNGTRTALVDGDQRVTWSQLETMVDGLARGLSDIGAVAGHRVAIDMANSIEFVTSYLAVLRGGRVAVPINPTSTTGEVARVLADSGSRVCFADKFTVDTVRGAIAGTAALIVAGAATRRGERQYASFAIGGAEVVSPRDAEALAVLLYTSGTSGHPRAAMLSHRALLANIDQASRTRPAPMVPDDIVLGVLPLFHVYGLNAVLGQVLLQGSTLVLGKRFDPEETLHLIATEQVTCVPVAPPVVAAWALRDDVAEKLTTVRTLLSGAAPLAADLVRSFEERTNIIVEQGYGLTEAAPIVTSTVGTSEHKPGSTGRALPGVELRVVDDSGEELQGDDPGEIWVRGRNLFSGYWPDGDGAPSSDGWLATGDIGFLDADGDLFLVDRLKELVIVSGFNVYPSEIEDVIAEVPGVRECAVIGVPDPATGEAVHAYVVAGPEVTQQQLRADAREHCERRLARFKVPSSIEVVARLPHSATGKVAKGRLRAAQSRRAMGLT